MKRTLITLALLALVGLALAQAELPGWDWSMLGALFDNVLFMAAAVVGLVNALRKWQPQIDGPILVPAVAIGIGAAVGTAGQLAGQLTATGFTDLAVPLGGILYGVTAAVAGTVSLNVLELVGNYIQRGKSDPTGQQHLALASTTNLNALVPVNAGAWIIEHIRSLVPSNKFTAAIEALAPLIGQFASQALTDELRATLQGRIHTTLRQAGLLKGRDL